jgi:hypothetical protein
METRDQRAARLELAAAYKRFGRLAGRFDIIDRAETLGGRNERAARAVLRSWRSVPQIDPPEDLRLIVALEEATSDLTDAVAEYKALLAGAEKVRNGNVPSRKH